MKVFLEREVKLDPGASFALPELPGRPLDARVFTSTYYDSPPRSLARSGITLRRRVENGLSRWQLKIPREDGRDELEAPAVRLGRRPSSRSSSRPTRGTASSRPWRPCARTARACVLPTATARWPT